MWSGDGSRDLVIGLEALRAEGGQSAQRAQGALYMHPQEPFALHAVAVSEPFLRGRLARATHDAGRRGRRDGEL